MPDKKIVAASLTLDTSQAGDSMKSFKAQLKDAVNNLHQVTEEFGATSKEAATAAKKVADLKDKIGDAKSLADAFSPDRKFAAFSNAINGVVGGFSALTGALGLFGVQSESVEKTLLKVQSAMALSQGINAILEAKDSFIQLGAKIKDTAAFQKLYAAGTAIAATVTKLFGGAVETTSTSFKILRGAIIATGIGALVVLITSAVNVITDWVNSTDSAEKSQQRLKDAIDQVNQALSKQQGELRRAESEAIARANAEGKSEEELYNIRKEFNDKNVESLGKAINDQQQLVQKLSTQRTKEGKETEAYLDAKKDLDAKRAQLEDALSKRIVDELNERTRIRRKNEADEKSDREKAEAAQKKADEKRKEEAKKLADFLKDLSDQVKKQRREDIKDIEDYGKQLQAVDDAETKRLADNEKRRLENKVDNAALDLANNPDSIEAKIAKINADLELELSAMDEGDLKRQIKTREAENAIAKIRKDASDAAIAEKKAEEEMKLMIIETALGQVADLIGRDSIAGKALSIAQATINTYLGASKALAQGGLFGGIAAAGVIAAGLANVKKIISVPLPGVKGGGGIAASMPNVSQPAPIAPAVNTNTLLNAQALNDRGSAVPQQQQPIQAFMIDSQAGDVRERSERLNRMARLGGG